MSSERAVVVTGGAGYIGSHICKELKRGGYLPVVLDHLEQGHAQCVRWGPLERGDVCDYPFVTNVLQRYRPVGVIHCAGLANIGESVTHPDRYYHTNVQGSLVLLEAMRHCQVNHLIFSSSCAVYGVGNQMPINENHPQSPISPYGWSKLMSERLIMDFGAAYGLKYALLRYFNASGADPDGELGELHQPETHLIPLVLDAALGHIPFLKLFGEQHATPDGTPIRDYIHVTDLAQAHVQALHQLEKNSPSLIVNLGSGRGHSVRDVIKAAETLIGKIIPVKVEAARPGDPDVLIADITLAKRLLAWTPTRSNLETILHTAWVWARKAKAKAKKV